MDSASVRADVPGEAAVKEQGSTVTQTLRVEIIADASRACCKITLRGKTRAEDALIPSMDETEARHYW